MNLETIKDIIIGRCFFCHKGSLYKNSLTIVEQCKHCHHNYSHEDSGDGPIFFVLSFFCFMTVILALWVEFSIQPPLLLHIILWPVFVFGGSILLLKPVKSLMIFLEIKHDLHKAR